MNLIDKFMGMLEEHGKYRTHALLRRMPEEQLRDMGISPELLTAGVKAWPWQVPADADTMPVKGQYVSLAAVKVEDVKTTVIPASAFDNAEKQQSAA